MSFKQISPFVIFPNDFFKHIESDNEFHTWISFQQLIKKNEFKESTVADALNHYDPITNERVFLRVQLNFYLMRVSLTKDADRLNLPKLIRFWVSCIRDRDFTDLYLNVLESHTFHDESLRGYGKYFYRPDLYVKYIRIWNEKTVDLEVWKKYKFLSVPDDFYFLNPIFKKHEGLVFPEAHMRELFNQHVDEIYESVFKCRLSNPILSEKEKVILTRIQHNEGSNDDKRYLKITFGLNSKNHISEILSSCSTNDVTIDRFDINSSFSYAYYFALIKYYENLKCNNSSSESSRPVMYFKGLVPRSKEIEAYEKLRDIFNRINSNCPQTKWGDFRSIFQKNGSNIKIKWIGDVDLLNYIFRKLGRHIKYSHGKWNVVAYYFYDDGKNKDVITEENLPGNSHYKTTKDEKLIDLIDSLISTLNQK